MISGYITPSGKVTVVDAGLHSGPAPLTASQPGGNYQVALRSGSGSILDRVSFPGSFTSFHEGRIADIQFLVALPAPPATASVAIAENGKPLMVTHFAHHKPAILRLRVRRTRRGYVISWRATDRDHARLVFTISEAAQGRQPALVLISGVTRPNYLLPLSNHFTLRGRRITVSVSDEFHIVTARSGPVHR
ncbi:MAG: hypothetical protein ACYC91_02475 [Solirubrobacteraceae bacterium]